MKRIQTVLIALLLTSGLAPAQNGPMINAAPLKVGVTTLDMAHAYETFATGGLRVYNPVLGAPDKGPIGIAEMQCYYLPCNGKQDIKAYPHYQRVIPQWVAQEVHDILSTAVPVPD